MIILPVCPNEKLIFLKKLFGNNTLEDNLIKVSYNKYIYALTEHPLSSIFYLKGIKIKCENYICNNYKYTHVINAPFIVYHLYDIYLRGFYVEDFYNEINYKEYLIRTGIFRNSKIDQILYE